MNAAQITKLKELLKEAYTILDTADVLAEVSIEMEKVATELEKPDVQECLLKKH